PVARGADRPRDSVGGGAAPTLVFARLRILNMWPQLVHLTVTPPGFSRASSSSYSVWHFSQRTSMVVHASACVRGASYHDGSRPAPRALGWDLRPLRQRSVSSLAGGGCASSRGPRATRWRSARSAGASATCRRA